MLSQPNNHALKNAMIKPNAGLSIVNQSAMLVAAGPCVCIIISLLLGYHSLCLVRKVLSLAATLSFAPYSDSRFVDILFQETRL
jgi:hypothetical protein